MRTTSYKTRHTIHLALDKPESYDSLRKHLCANFGGYTLTEAKGGWLDSPVIIEETSYIITLYDNTDKSVESFCEIVKGLYKQTEVIYTSELVTYNSIL